jgi:hypothetical protein
MAQGPHERAVTVAHISRDHRRPGEVAQPRQEVGRQIRRSGVHPRDLPSSIDTVIVKVGLPECLDLREEVRKQRLALVHDQESPKSHERGVYGDRARTTARDQHADRSCSKRSASLR